MNVQERTSPGFQPESGRGKLALLGFAIVLMTAAIAARLPAYAAEPSATVSLAGLDLSTDKGMQAARDRLLEAARRVCDKLLDPWSVSYHPDYLRCVDETTADAMGQIQGLIRVADAKSRAQTPVNR
jgi:UrcA family protein